MFSRFIFLLMASIFMLPQPSFASVSQSNDVQNQSFIPNVDDKIKPNEWKKTSTHYHICQLNEAGLQINKCVEYSSKEECHKALALCNQGKLNIEPSLCGICVKGACKKNICQEDI